MNAVVESAMKDAMAYERGGANALFIENFGDHPFTRGSVEPETVAGMAVVGAAVKSAVKLPIGFNVLRNDARSALALCAACGGSFIRVNVHTGAMVTDQGLIEGNAHETIRLRAQLCPKVLIFADVHVKHAVPLGNLPIEISARDTVERGLADALIISGTGTGVAAEMDDLQRVREVLPMTRVLVGSGVTPEMAGDYLRLADGLIVGTSLKVCGEIDRPVDPRRVATLCKAIRHAALPRSTKKPAQE